MNGRIELSRTQLNGLPPGFLERKRLLGLFDKASRKKLTLISAPAGFGKTALVHWWASTSHENICWLTLEEEDNSYPVFLLRMIESLQKVCANVGHFVRSAVHEGQDISPKPAAISILNEIATNAVSVSLVLDNFQLVNNPLVHETVESLLRLPSTCFDAVIVTRRDPSLRVASMRALDQITEIRAQELRLNAAEVEAYLNDTLQLELDRESIELIAQRCEGWIAGLRLVAYTLAEKTADQKKATLRSFCESTHFIFDFLNEEVFEMQPASVKEFLLKTSVLDPMSGPLCKAVVGAEAALTELEVLGNGGLFLEEIDQDKGVFRYHRLFLEFLRHRLRQTSPALISELHRSASDWYAHNGYEVQALRHALLALDSSAANQGSWSMNRGRSESDWYFEEANIDAIQAWLLTDEIPVSPVEAALLPYRDWALLWAASPHLIEVQLARSTEGPANGSASLLGALLSHLKGDPADATAQASLALDYLPATDRLGRLLGRYLLGMGSVRVGDFTKARNLFSSIGWDGVQQSSPRAIALGLGKLASLATLQGDLEEAQHILAIATSYMEDIDDKVFGSEQLKAIVLLSKARVLYQQNSVELAAEYLERAMQACKKWPLLADEYIDATITYAKLLSFALSHTSKALSVIQSAVRWVDYFNLGKDRLNQLQACEVHLRLTSSYQQDMTKRWSAENLEQLANSVDYASEYERFVLARVLISDRQAQAVPGLLARIQSLASSQNRLLSVVTCQILEALAYQALGDMHKACRLIEMAILNCESMGFVRVFADEHWPMAALLTRAMADIPGLNNSSLAGRIIGELERQMGRMPNPATSQPVVRYEELTKRESEVLKLLANDLPAREIADELVVSLNTVKTHIKRIYGKLGAHSRFEAIVRARDYNILQ